jgi:hypothetical protein
VWEELRSCGWVGDQCVGELRVCACAHRERPEQSDEELLARWEAMPRDVPRFFKTHASPGPQMDFDESRRYIVVFRSPEEALCSFYPFLRDHSEELWKLWDAEHRQYNMVRPTFVQWFDEVALPQDKRTADAETPGGMINSLFTTFINNWWPHRHKPNVLVLHFADMKKDHDGSVRRIADFLGFKPSAEEWSKVFECMRVCVCVCARARALTRMQARTCVACVHARVVCACVRVRACVRVCACARLYAVCACLVHTCKHACIGARIHKLPLDESA